MALFEDKKFSKTKFRKCGNIYLDNSNKGLELISKIFSKPKPAAGRAAKLRLYNLIKERLIPLLSEADINGELNMLYALNRICETLQRPSAIEVIDQKNVVGIGGRFSAGKSCFINSLIMGGKRLLPEDMEPTTSISTYIVNGNKRENIAVTAFGNDVRLTDKAVAAIAHQFYEHYKIGFSRYINNIVLKTPDWQYENIALMDTPGYNKYDGNKKQEASDLTRSKEQLKNADYIIWLTDIDTGTLKDEDIQFLENVAPQSEVLFVVNKADKKIPEQIKVIVDGIKDIVNDTGIKCYDVVAYNSVDGIEYLTSGVIDGFLSKANVKQTVYDPAQICEEIIAQIKAQVVEITNYILDLEKKIACNTDVLNSKSLVDILRSSVAHKHTVERQLVCVTEILNKIRLIRHK